MKLLIKDGFVVSKSYYGKYDIEIQNGKIVKVKKCIKPSNHKIVNASRCYILPGIIDAHTHFNLKAYNSQTLEDFYTGTKTALVNGITTVIDYIIPQQNETVQQAVNRRINEAKNKSFTDFTFHLQIVNIGQNIKKEIKYAIFAGIKSFKVFLPKTENWYINDGELYILLKELSRYKNVVLEVHAENGDIIDILVKELKKCNRLDVKYFYLSRPNVVEYEAVRRVLSINSMIGCNIYFVHLSTKEALQEIMLWKNIVRNYKIFTETCPQYLQFTSRVYKKKVGYLYTCCPPIKSETDKEFLWKAVKNNIIDVIATDNCVFSKKLKYKFRNNFQKIPMGLPGVSILLYYVITEGRKRNIHIKQLVQKITSSPAEIFSLYPTKGDFVVNKSDADIVVYRPNVSWKIKLSKLNTVADYTVYEGYKVDGVVEKVILRGKLMVDKGNLLIEKPIGKFLYRR